MLDTTFIIRQITKQHHVLIHISIQPNVANDSKSKEKRGIISAIYIFLFSPRESQDVRHLTKNVPSLMNNQNLQQLFIETSAQANNITHIHSV